MPKKKKIIKATKKTAITKKKTVATKTEETKHKKINLFKWGESYTSLLLGIILVIIFTLFVTSIIKSQPKKQITATSTVITPTPVMENAKSTYVVKSGDNLWDIAVANYNNGYKWTDIAKENKLANPSLIFSGDKLIIPGTTPTLTPIENFGDLQVNKNQNDNGPVPGIVYIVKKGDNLWNIALKAYADGYKWTDIAKENKLANPSLIFSGDKLIIPL